MNKTITINPDLFKIPNGNRSSKKRKSKDEEAPKIKFKSQAEKPIRNKTTKRAILKFIRDNQEKNYKKMMENGERPTNSGSSSSPTTDKFNGDFKETLKFFENVNKDIIQKQNIQFPKNKSLKSQNFVIDTFLAEHAVLPKKTTTTTTTSTNANINIEIPDILNDFTHVNIDSIPYSIGGEEIKLNNQFTTANKNVNPKWGCLKGGSLPTFRNFQKTHKVYPSQMGGQIHSNSQKMLPVKSFWVDTPNPNPSANTNTNIIDDNSEEPKFNISNIIGGIRVPDRISPLNLIQKQEKEKEKTQNRKSKMRYPKQKRTVKREFKLGKSEKHPKIGILISNKTIRKHITTQSKMLKQHSIQDVKKHLIKHGFIKIGSSAPNEVLREMYETSKMMCGEIYNHNPDTLMYNFFNDTAPL